MSIVLPAFLPALLTLFKLVLYFLAMVANPIFINTMVVFVRLYWFEKRFQHVVREATSHSSRSRTRTNPRATDGPDLGREELGVNGRDIIVLHDQGKSIGPGMVLPSKPTSNHAEPETSSSSSSNFPAEHPALIAASEAQSLPQASHPQTNSFHRDIVFADEVESSPAPTTQNNHVNSGLDQQMSSSEHKTFLENQRNPQGKEALRIPGPRDFDRGEVPEVIQHDEEKTDRIAWPMERVDQDEKLLRCEDQEHLNGHHPSLVRNTVIDQPEKQHQTTSSTYNPKSILGRRGANASKATNEISPSTHVPRRSATFSSMGTHSMTGRDPIPYLSWEPTVGRNSAFVDLTEEQREELGGIEYRSLKTLAVILVSMSTSKSSCLSCM